MTNRPCSIYQYLSMALRLWGKNCKFFKFLFSLNSQKGLRYKENNTKYGSLIWKPLSHVRILICRTWPIAGYQLSSRNHADQHVTFDRSWPVCLNHSRTALLYSKNKLFHRIQHSCIQCSSTAIMWNRTGLKSKILKKIEWQMYKKAIAYLRTTSPESMICETFKSFCSVLPVKLQSRIGTLQFACMVAVSGRTSVQWAINLTRGVPSRSHHIWLKKEFFKDLGT